jgi:hypothetical protein
MANRTAVIARATGLVGRAILHGLLASLFAEKARGASYAPGRTASDKTLDSLLVAIRALRKDFLLDDREILQLIGRKACDRFIRDAVADSRFALVPSCA